MAHPSSVGVADYKPAIILTTTATASITLNPHKVYHIWHMGVDGGGAADTNNIFLSTAATDVDADDSADNDKLKLEDGHPFPIVISGWSTLYFESAGTDPTFQIVPVGMARDI